MIMFSRVRVTQDPTFENFTADNFYADQLFSADGAAPTAQRPSTVGGEEGDGKERRPRWPSATDETEDSDERDG